MMHKVKAILIFAVFAILLSVPASASELEDALTKSYQSGTPLPFLHIFVGDNAPTTDVILMSNINGYIQLIAGTTKLPPGVSTLCSEYSSELWRTNSLFIDIISSQKTAAENGKVGLYADDSASLDTIQLRNAVSNYLKDKKITVITGSKDSKICEKYPTADTIQDNQANQTEAEMPVEAPIVQETPIEQSVVQDASQQDSLKKAAQISIPDNEPSTEQEEETGLFAGIAKIFTGLWNALMSYF